MKWQRISWLGHLERMGEDRIPKKIFTQELEETRRRGRPRNETKGKTQERMERRSRKRSDGSEKMDRVSDREKWRGIVRQAKAHGGL
jgi:hypothetical protein